MCGQRSSQSSSRHVGCHEYIPCSSRYQRRRPPRTGLRNSITRFRPETKCLWRVKDSTLEPPASARIVGNEPGPVEVGVVRVLRGDTTCSNEDARLEHAPHHGAHTELARSLKHAQRGRETSALD